MKQHFSVVSPDAKLGKDVRIYDFVNIYGAAEIGDESIIGAFVEIQPGVVIGRRVKVSSHSFLCTGVTLEDESFVGHGVMFINDRFPASVDEQGVPTSAATTNVIPTIIKRKAAIGTGATIMCGVTIGENALVGAGSVVLKDVPPGVIVAGNPARVIGQNKASGAAST